MAKVFGSRLFFLHTKIVSNSRSSAAPILLLTCDDRRRLKMPSGERMCICYTFNPPHCETCLPCDLRSTTTTRFGPKVRRRSIFKRTFSFISSIIVRWCPPTMMLMDISRKHNQSMTAWVKMNIDGYLRVHVRTCVIWPSRKWVMENVHRWMHLATWRSDECFRWQKIPSLPWEFPLCCG